MKGIQGSTGRTVAIKLLREAAALTTLDHPNIVGFIDRGVSADGDHNLVMDYIEGCSLREFLDQRGPAVASEAIPLDDAAAMLRFFGMICWAIDFAHQRGIIHRDLSPPSILINQFEEPQVVDFGLARTHLDTVRRRLCRAIALSESRMGRLVRRPIRLVGCGAPLFRAGIRELAEEFACDAKSAVDGGPIRKTFERMPAIAWRDVTPTAPRPVTGRQALDRRILD